MDGSTFILLLIVTILNWLPSLGNAEDSKASMYNNKMNSNIMFYSSRYEIGIHAHKYILAESSPVFKEMFESEPSVKYIREDVNEKSIAAFLRFIYKEKCPDNFETFLEVLGLAKKYEVVSFKTTCKLEFKVPWPAFKVIEKLLEANAEDMAEQWWPRIESRLDEIIASEYFLKINQRTLAAFLKRDTLCYPEIDLFHAVIKWCIHQCDVQGVRATTENVRNIIGDAIFQVRFLAISEEDFKRHVVGSKILSDDEVNAIIETMTSDTSNNKYHWALPERNKRAWYCKYFSTEQMRNEFVKTILLICFALVVVGFTAAAHLKTPPERRLEQHRKELQPSEHTDHKTTMGKKT